MLADSARMLADSVGMVAESVFYSSNAMLDTAEYTLAFITVHSSGNC